MQHQIHLATHSGVVSNQAVEQIRKLIADLKDAARVLGATIRVKQKYARSNDLQIVTALAMRRSNLQASIVVLEDHLEIVEKLRSHRGSTNLLHPHAASLRV